MTIEAPKSKNKNSNGKRLLREDWIDAAWDILGKGSVDDIKIKVLAEKLGVTRGGFYWHFSNRQNLIDTLVDRWFTILGVEQVMKPAVASIKDPSEQLWAIFLLVITTISAGQGVAFRLHSKENIKLRRRIEAEDQARLAHFSTIFGQLGFSKQHASEKARIYLAVLVSEFLRNGALSKKQRIADAKKLHAILTATP